MARITVEDCLAKVDNRFGLIHLAAKRVRQLRKGAEPLVHCNNNDVVVSLREIAQGHVFQTYGEEDIALLKNKDAPAPEEPPEETSEMSPDQEPEDQEETIEEK